MRDASVITRNLTLAAPASASDLRDDITQPNLTGDIINTLRGRHSWLMKWAFLEMIFAIILTRFCTYPMFLRDTMISMTAYASATIICVIAYAAVPLFI